MGILATEYLIWEALVAANQDSESERMELGIWVK
jgi:hypothetical protein